MPHCNKCGAYITEREKKDSSHRCNIDDTMSSVISNSILNTRDPIPSPVQQDQGSSHDYGGGDFGGGGASGDYGGGDSGGGDGGGGSD